jgi:carbonic anhydrase
MPDSILKRSHLLRAKFFEGEQELLENLAQHGQSPEAMFIGCCDSRVVPELLLGARPGDLYVTRVVANIVPPYGFGQYAIGAATEHAVLRVGVKHIILCGHTGCGGIQALDENTSIAAEPSIAGWIEFARPAQRRVDAHGGGGGDRHQAIVKENVLLQLDNLQTYPAVRHALTEKKLELHGWVYDLANREILYYDPAQRRFVAFVADST